MTRILFFILTFSISLTVLSQSAIPSVEIRDIDGGIINTSDISNDGKPIVISFWATWCKPCVKELTAIAELYDEWQTETGVKVIAISVDDSKSMARVKPFVNAKAWDFDVLLDPNSDFKRAMNVVNVPHTFLLNGNIEVVSQHTTYAEGDEEELFEKIQELVTD